MGGNSIDAIGAVKSKESSPVSYTRNDGKMTFKKLLLFGDNNNFVHPKVSGVSLGNILNGSDSAAGIEK